MIEIRPFEDSHWPEAWRAIEPVFRAGETYPYARDISESDAKRVWVENPAATYVVLDGDDGVLGTYYIKANQPDLGGHVCNCGYIVAENARGKGIGSQMCEHSQQEAVRLGFLSMQYNLVVSTNEGAMRLWRGLGFEIVGTLPKAFRHARLGLVDAYVMYKILQS